jgi:chaperonin GroEL
MSYNPKQLHFGSDARAKLISGVTKLSKAVKSTMGPRGNTVLIESPTHTRGMTITKDGATVARSIELIDPVENLACRMMKDASENTANSAGDGTSSSIVLTEALIVEGMNMLKEAKTEGMNINKTEVLRHIQTVGNEVLERIKANVIETTDELIRSVATISANNDDSIGGLIAEVYKGVGKGGVVHYEKSKTFETYHEIIKGLKVERGFRSQGFINDQETDTFTVEDCYVLVCDHTIGDFTRQLHTDFIQTIIHKKVLFITPMTNHALNTLVLNVNKNGFKWCVIEPPAMGYRQKELMSDIATSVGAKYFSEESGDNLELISFSDLGRAEKVTVSRDRTIIIPPANEYEKEVAERCEQITRAYEKSTKPKEKEFLKERIAMLMGGVGIIYAGGQDMEQKELYDRIEDAVSAVQSAIEEGVIAGAGRTLYVVSNEIKEGISQTDEEAIARLILSAALKAPAKQIVLNAGLKYEELYNNVPVDMVNYGVNIKNMQAGNLIEMGIVDPYKVARISLQNAISVATTILSTNAVVIMAREIEKASVEEL